MQNIGYIVVDVGRITYTMLNKKNSAHKYGVGVKNINLFYLWRYNDAKVIFLFGKSKQIEYICKLLTKNKNIMEIPDKVKEIMKRYGMNDAELVGDGLYLLSLKSDSNDILPTGLPLVVDYHMGNARILSDSEALNMISKL